MLMRQQHPMPATARVSGLFRRRVMRENKLKAYAGVKIESLENRRLSSSQTIAAEPADGGTRGEFELSRPRDPFVDGNTAVWGAALDDNGSGAHAEMIKGPLAATFNETEIVTGAYTARLK